MGLLYWALNMWIFFYLEKQQIFSKAINPIKPNPSNPIHIHIFHVLFILKKCVLPLSEILQLIKSLDDRMQQELFNIY